MNIWGKTDIGKVRKINQDNYFAEILENDIAILCVCDGMGGQKAGHIASEQTLEQFTFLLKQEIKQIMTEEEIIKMLEDAVFKANEYVYELANSQEHLNEMGTTLVGGILYRNSLYVANVGDSRCYLVNEDGITKVTKDHSLVQQLLDEGKITLEESLDHPQKNYITKAMGVGRGVKSDIYKIELVRKEYILLCSDGLYNHIEDEDIKRHILKSETIEKKCNELIDIANFRGGYDNITAIILQF